MSCLIQDMTHLFVILGCLDLAVLEDAHHDGSRAVGSGMLSKVIGSRELLAALVALERFVLSVERAVMAFEVFLSSEAARAQGADEGLGRVFGERLLATTTARGEL